MVTKALSRKRAAAGRKGGKRSAEARRAKRDAEIAAKRDAEINAVLDSLAQQIDVDSDGALYRPHHCDQDGPERSLRSEIIEWTWDEFADVSDFGDPYGLGERMRELGIPAATEDVMEALAEACTDTSVLQGMDCAWKLHRTRRGWRWRKV